MKTEKYFLITPIALAATLAATATHAEVGNGRIAGMVERLGTSLRGGNEMRPAADADANSRAPNGILSERNERGGEAFASSAATRDEGSLPGLRAADRDLADRTGEPRGINLDLNLGNTSDDSDARGLGLRITHDSNLHLRTPEDGDSVLSDDTDTLRTGLASSTGIHVMSSRENDDGDRERVANGIETGADLFNHAPAADSDEDGYRNARLSAFGTQRTVEDGLIGDDEEGRRYGAAVGYDSRDGVSFETARERDE